MRRQAISIAWQNGDYEGHDAQAFIAPGIGEGEVRCRPPNPEQPTGVQWVRFHPYDNGTKSSPPERWATTMWTQRVGGDLSDPDHETTNVIRTARLDRANQVSGFHESMNTLPVGTPERSTGTFDGLITTEPLDEATVPPHPTSFRLSWHWNFEQTSSARCYVNAIFLTENG